MKHKRYRTGQRVRSIYDPRHTFRIDKSLVPERIFHEEGSDRWWTKNELEAITAPLSSAKAPEPKDRIAISRMRSLAFKGAAAKRLRAGTPLLAPKERKCLECGIEFRPRRRWQKFHTDACRRANWKRANLAVNQGHTLEAMG